MPKTSGHDRLPALDALRGIGAVIVALAHFAYAFPAHGGWPPHVFNATAAVGMFFALSGFVLSRKYLAAQAAPLPLIPYLIARLARIWIPFVVAVALALIAQRYLTPQTCPSMGSEFASRWAQGLTMSEVLSQMNPAHCYSSNLVAPSWSLHPELIMSLWLPLLVLAARRSIFWLLFFVGAGVATGVFTPYMIAFSAGIALAKQEAKICSAMTCPVKWLIAGICALIYFVPVEGLPGNAHVFWGLLSAAIFAVVLSSPTIQRMGNRSIPAHLGRISFGLYLLHWPLMGCLAPAIFWLLTWAGITGVMAWWITLAGWLAGVVGIATVFHHLCERPAIWAGRSVGQRVMRCETWLAQKLPM